MKFRNINERGTPRKSLVLQSKKSKGLKNLYHLWKNIFGVELCLKLNF